MCKILTLNSISVLGLERLSRERYEVASEIQNPDAILLRSYKMRDMELPQSLKAVGRAGVGVNNIPVDKLSRLGIPVFNTPGANANAVKELVLAAMFLAARNLCPAWNYARNLAGTDQEIQKQVEAGKKQFKGFELPGRTLGVIGLGAIGVLVSNAALSLGMKVIGYDPSITVRRAWQLSSAVRQAISIDDLLARSDFVSVHVPLTDTTRQMLDDKRLPTMRDGATLLNFSRGDVVDENAVIAALNAGKLHAYVCDFPSNALKDNQRVIMLPHLGASTKEAEDNCAIMVADQVREFLEEGTIRNSVNFPTVEMAPGEGFRIAVVNANVPNMLGQISTTLADAHLNILDMSNRSRDGLAYTLIDVQEPVPSEVIGRLKEIEGVMRARSLGI
uniref:D-3-phosphoglycerate dehydrogenase n=1 Tax=Candidatus Kentrum sp. TUN TaxID=2126343 RepID=A0A451A090_9GAMM|nr:MAG: D-3-phosphoglycerate dehydrogenase [Candidatus Kentron sp. TUN]VFK58916.1 MAG: D-3-phosphoglycerate dehydrogenase [Candidatus Kentron sp. TUN]VFK59442.1 MAG: D-3-phosphoglycerate dehydrogenase [Candidatus Kentron sp. TUN]